MSRPRPAIADYSCCSCKHRWNDAPGPVACPACGDLYVRWLNYAELFEDTRQHALQTQPTPQN